jgi:hypothetical protein
MFGILVGCHCVLCRKLRKFLFCGREVDRDNASSVAILQDIFKDSSELKALKTDLAYIHANFSFLSQSITKLERATNLLSETITEVNDIHDNLKKTNSSNVDAVKQKSHSCFSKNKGFKVMYKISCVLEGEDLVDSEDLKDLSLSDIMCYKYARLVSCDVERAFPQYRSLP